MQTSEPESRALEHYQQIIRLPTMSRLAPTDVDWAQFDRFVGLLPDLYPALHATAEREIVAGWALLYRWRGHSDAQPTVLMAHYDVVGASDDGWTFCPFSGDIVGEGPEATIVGRGAIDDKASLVGILEAVEAAVLACFTPANDIYLAFSHNEEVLGDGTPTIVALLAERGIRPHLVLDEGGIVGESIFPGVEREVVYVGVSEKGTALLRMSCTGPGGHASVPPVETTTVRLARAILEVHEAGAAPQLNDVTRRMIELVGPHATGEFGRAAASLAVDESAAITAFASISRDANAMVHSMPLVTMVTAGEAPNALPERASALVNLRIAEGHAVDEVIARITASVSDPEIEFEVIEKKDASPVSPSTGPVWDLLESSIHAIFGDVIVAPYVNNGGTDSRNYTAVCDNVYRFSPYDMTLAERRSIHAVDERLRLSSFFAGTEFYRHLLQRL